MTYCVALRLNRGLVFAADTRTNAGVDNIAQFRKIHYWRKPGERVLVLLAAGNLSLTQSVVSLLNEQLVEREEEPEAVNLFNVPSMYRATRLVGDAVRSIRAIDGAALEATKTGFAGSSHPLPERSIPAGGEGMLYGADVHRRAFAERPPPGVPHTNPIIR